MRLRECRKRSERARMLRTGLSIMHLHCVGRTRGYDDWEVPEPHAIRDGAHRRLTDSTSARRLAEETLSVRHLSAWL